MSELSDEEKKAIKLLKSYENKLVYEISDKDKKAVKTVLNLIEIQQKEIEELKELLKGKTMRIGFENQDNYISKDKIKEKIEKIKKEQEKDIFNHMMTVDNGYNIKCQVLKELLEEKQ